ncbi:MAG: NADH-quinone oxidoreductase subunit J [Gammaproteobacteria bacterium]|nr:NADH-quinone oxidoreductase subunit J [Gammaproteobacteria bacterium]MCP4476450.1 NADH-quinone oxidoreductase subunit J [Gammaproteobacteria bacterium]
MTTWVADIIFYASAVVALLAATCVVLGRNPVFSVLALVITFVATAVLWVMMRAEFLGLILVVVYVGAVMTLFLFVVMMLNLNQVMKHRSLVRGWPFALVVALLILVALVALLGPWHISPALFPLAKSSSANYSSTQSLGNLLFSQYLLPFELAGVLLLVGMIAAIALTKGDPSFRQRQSISKQVKVEAKDRLTLVKDGHDTDKGKKS